ncbi:MAG TPA: hypothetical protein VGK87_11895 [Anaerolineae bacterium]
MRIILTTVLMVCTLGTASQYGPGVMESVIYNRQAIGSLPMELPRVDGYIAVYDCSKVGSVWQVNDERFLVADCAGDDYTRLWMMWNAIGVEVDYDTAVRWHTVGVGKVVNICQPETSPVRPHTLE